MTVYIEVRVKPGSKRDHVSVLESPAGRPLLTVELKAQARDGKANAALIRLLARHFGVSQRAVTIKRGAASRNKIVDIV
ncbi:MAG: hypothetical protein A2855_02710 [Candidatus Liptonbacteria bacterium RIFCSPHIGHO2_01_FULL_57_28]|uniref:UPF0235 protein A2855_02710 n=1 Tax=Candidatus Liptonbacteria bacterium RIFCSPHIGHO2_01_FULL_57_28 TaxID=1798647 RepID=A0A1G2CB29_9BACT|nr:MAG: hypothetical protein A2855_02710 [Candidatus Liptonbacteria bacterium RIFCSPHIGHO2_01_FULL_57_28]